MCSKKNRKFQTKPTDKQDPISVQTNSSTTTSETVEASSDAMNKLKKFLQEKKLDKKFKSAGKGQTLAGSGSPARSPQASSAVPSYQPPSDSETRRQTASQLADAVEKRLQGSEKNLTYAQKKIREQARRELEEEERKKKLESGEVDARKDERDGEKLFEHTEQISSVSYTCELLDDDIVLPRKEMIDAVEQFLTAHLSEEPIEAAIIMFWSLNQKEKIDIALPIIHKYISNILLNPDEPKFRKIKTTNKVFIEKVKPVKGAVDFLRGVGFREELMDGPDGAKETFLVFQNTESDALGVLEDYMAALQYGEPVSLKLYRDPKVFRVDSSKPIPKAEVPSDFFILSPEELKREQKQREQEAERLQTLRTSKMREEDARLRKYNYKYTLIRIRFPNHIVLQGVFGVHEKFSTLREFIASKLQTQSGTFVLTDPTNGGQTFSNDEKSFADYGLMPAAVVFFDWDQDTMAQFAQQNLQPSFLTQELNQKAQVL
ncbi:unnamed protein product [Bursaphelenchus okinawaensis]|uniref:UBX domain-containing protein n=1 Tax=Bursaphelenchus okinawaensis TaxID=465554 RepID=A0A811KRN9_9BILA|nr:unnamed protein product [Bursaphelenchus okinawaensis]CAG9111887.1 unnamed protein product [Bursaphelenchus okinawaensis]